MAIGVIRLAKTTKIANAIRRTLGVELVFAELTVSFLTDNEVRHVSVTIASESRTFKTLSLNL